MGNGNGYIGVNGISKKLKKGYIGVDGKSRKLKKAYLGVNGKSKLVWSGENILYMSVYNFSNLSGNGTYEILDDGASLKLYLKGVNRGCDTLYFNAFDFSSVPMNKRILHYDTKYSFGYTYEPGYIPIPSFIINIFDSVSHMSYLTNAHRTIEGEQYKEYYDNTLDLRTSDNPNMLRMAFTGYVADESGYSPQTYTSIYITNLRFADGTKILFTDKVNS